MREHEKSQIERHGRRGQTSEQLAERNSLGRIAVYAVLSGVAFGILGNLVFPSLVVAFVFVGLLLGAGLAVAIEEKMKRQDAANRAQTARELAAELARERKAEIEAAKANGTFDRWEQK